MAAVEESPGLIESELHGPDQVPLFLDLLVRFNFIWFEKIGLCIFVFVSFGDLWYSSWYWFIKNGLRS